MSTDRGKKNKNVVEEGSSHHHKKAAWIINELMSKDDGNSMGSSCDTTTDDSQQFLFDLDNLSECENNIHFLKNGIKNHYQLTNNNIGSKTENILSIKAVSEEGNHNSPKKKPPTSAKVVVVGRKTHKAGGDAISIIASSPRGEGAAKLPTGIISSRDDFYHLKF